jgi:hypothetical protein
VEERLPRTPVRFATAFVLIEHHSPHRSASTPGYAVTGDMDDDRNASHTVGQERTFAELLLTILGLGSSSGAFFTSPIMLSLSPVPAYIDGNQR